MKILIVQVMTPDIKDYSMYSLPTNIEYSIKWNYDYLLYTAKKTEINYHPAWLKITSFYDIKVDKYDWIWILDADAKWQAPTDMPVEEGKFFTWDEPTLSWVEVELPA